LPDCFTFFLTAGGHYLTWLWLEPPPPPTAFFAESHVFQSRSQPVPCLLIEKSLANPFAFSFSNSDVLFYVLAVLGAFFFATKLFF
jgi:threonine/homoserine/homoserine lactone efflux protein